MKKFFEEATIEVRNFAVEDIMAYCAGYVPGDNETPIG